MRLVYASPEPTANNISDDRAFLPQRRAGRKARYGYNSHRTRQAAFPEFVLNSSWLEPRRGPERRAEGGDGTVNMNLAASPDQLVKVTAVRQRFDFANVRVARAAISEANPMSANNGSSLPVAGSARLALSLRFALSR